MEDPGHKSVIYTLDEMNNKKHKELEREVKKQRNKSIKNNKENDLLYDSEGDILPLHAYEKLLKKKQQEDQ